jgi:hypothetical protein
MHITPHDLARWDRILDELEWSDRRLAQAMGLDANTPYGWRCGNAPIPLYAWRFVEMALSIKRAYEPLRSNDDWRRHSRGNPKVKARMDAQALKRFRDAGIL